MALSTPLLAYRTSPLLNYHHLFCWAAALAYLLGPDFCLEPRSNWLGPWHYWPNSSWMVAEAMQTGSECALLSL